MDVATAGMLGRIVGGIMAIFIAASLLEWAIFKRVFDDPVKGKVGSVVAAYILTSTIYAFLSADAGQIDTSGFGFYLPGAVLIGFLGMRRGLRLREQIEAQEGTVL